MRMLLTLSLLGLCAVAAGCNLLILGAGNIAEETHFKKEIVVSHHRLRALADEAWSELQKSGPAHSYSLDYELGFKDGFVDYLYAGGPGHPPPVPPRHYWDARYETPSGHHAIEEWYAGYEHGVQAALASGYRQQLILPLPAITPICVDGSAPLVVEENQHE